MFWTRSKRPQILRSRNLGCSGMRHWRAGLLKALAQFAPFRGGAAFGCVLAPDRRQMARLLLKGLGGIQVLFGSSPGRCNALLGRFLPRLRPPNWRPLFLLGCFGPPNGRLLFFKGCFGLWSSRPSFRREPFRADIVLNEASEIMRHKAQVPLHLIELRKPRHTSLIHIKRTIHLDL